MDLSVPEELRMVQTTIRKFVESEVIPHERDYHDDYQLPEEIRLPLRDKVKALGMWNLGMPVGLGGGGLFQRPAPGEALPRSAEGADHRRPQ